jgi:hypothetical protein
LSAGNGAAVQALLASRQRGAMIAPASRHISGSGPDTTEGGEPEKR